ncbi:type 11 methyltransferase [Caballeronia terrestris]|uniref:Type 11 methyltransferase n=1 Tax=Caballeronia terrestris TaxID=1226301 RepID=A0A158F7I9_9BURK|nr:rhamnan synthesis F family protein [Caballeronia terrestris]SAL15737.1 type 11 methyltransferase [Caballeronia terrestris]
MTVQLPATGERFLPDSMSGDITLEHQHRYYAALDLARGLDVLDVAAGEGYGSALLAGVARSVVGVDIDANAVAFAERKYASSTLNLRFAAGSCTALPLADASVDLVVSFETIEHHDEHEAMLAEIRRVLRPGGVLVISSPDRHEYSDLPGYKNPFHVKELYRQEFAALLAQSFRAHRLYGQRVRQASLLFALDATPGQHNDIVNYLSTPGAGAVERESGTIAPRYLIAVASDAPVLPALAVGTFAAHDSETATARLTESLEAWRKRAENTARELEHAQASSRAASADAARLRTEIEDWRKHASNLQTHADAQDITLHEVAARHGLQLKEAHDLGLKDADERVAKAVEPLEAQLATLRDAIADRDAQFQAVVRSASWRVTRPLRVGRRIGARLKALRPARPLAEEGPRGPVVTEDFDETYYVRRYADVARAGGNPYQHYLMFGRVEGRSGRPPKLHLRETKDASRAILEGAAPASATHGAPKRGTVLVVSHEATRTGAPVLAWNICRELREHYHVVALLLGKGGLVEAFDEVCDAVAGPYLPAERDPLALSAVIDELCRRYAFDFAIVNSIASRAVLEPLAERFVPTALLMHEFFRFHCSADELVDAFAWAGQVVFSATIVRDSADIERTHPAILRSHVLPQGKSQIPADPARENSGSGGTPADAAARIDKLQKKILGARTKKPFIVLGAGTIEYRKGVDLFVATAAEIRRIAPDADILMVWIGGVVPGYKQYADFVATQVEQADLSDRVEFVGETPDLEALYRFADLCFISSRLDPLPNIALDAVAAGLPVLSFERATGVAENFIGDPQLEQCVLPFLNVEEAARRVVALYHAPELRRAVCEHALQLAERRFNMTRYVETLIGMSKQGKQATAQEERDVEALLAGEDFAEWFFLPPGSLTSRADAIRKFVKAAQGGIFARKPAPGFYPHRYVERHDLGPEQINPLVHYVTAGKPAGEWQEPLIDVSKPRPVHTDALRIAVHIHAFYPELLADIISRLAASRLKADLFVSVPSQEIATDCRRQLAGYRFGSVVLRVVPNRGRDIGPFVTEFAADLTRYDLVGHFHTKKSVHVEASSDLVRNWVNHVMETLLGGAHPAAETIVSAFADDPALGMVFADDPHMIGWDKNLPFAKPLAEKLGLAKLPEQFFSFPVGTMFWARPAALAPLFALGLDWDDYPPEPLPIDGSMLHALERLLPSVVELAGLTRRVSFLPGVTR